MCELFETWSFHGVRFLAMGRADGVLIVDSNRQSYGMWRSVESFRTKQKRGDYSVTPLCKVRDLSPTIEYPA